MKASETEIRFKTGFQQPKTGFAKKNGINIPISSNKCFLDIRNHRLRVVGISHALIIITGSFTIIAIYGPIFA